ncbi:MAG TPA: hypothetical protein DCO79_13015 [Spirochaeta sp.]|nr:hypothetical protein [Spirochaeta sp.]
MTLRLRNTLLISLAFVSAAGLAIIARTIVFNENITGAYLLEWLPMIILNLFATITCIIIFFTFRNTASSEIFFYYIFIFSFIFDIFRFSHLLTPAFPIFTVYPMAATRLAYYGRFAGALSLFSAGLFTTGLEYQRMSITSLIILVLPAVLVIVLPVDVSSSVPGGTWEIGRFHEITIALSLLHLFAILNFLIAGQKNESREYLIIAASLLTAICGRELIFYFTGWVPAAGFILMLGGTISFGLRTHRLYLWD